MGMDRKIEKKTWPRRRIIIYGAGGLIMVFLVALLVFGDTSSALNVESQKISISTVERGPFQELIPVTGTVLPLKSVYMDAMDGGRVDQIFVEEGAMVKEGDPILRMTNTNLQMEMMFREADLFEQMNNLRAVRLAMEQNRLSLREQMAEIDYQNAVQSRNYERARALHSKDVISKEEFERTRDDYEYWRTRKELVTESQRQDSIMRDLQVQQLEQSIQRMQQNFKIVKENYENLVQRAPISGQLSQLNAEIGELKSPGERLGQVDVLDGYKVRAAIDEYYISRIAQGQTAEAELAGEKVSLLVRRVYPEVRDGRFEIDLEFTATAPRGIRRGQSIQLRLALGELSEALMIARGGFYQTTGGNWIYVLDESGDFARKRRIRLGRQNPRMYEVLEGLEVGEKVITSSYDNYGDFEKLNLN